MLVSVPAETRPGERRVALTPESVALLVGQGHDVCVESGAGQGLLATRRRLPGRRRRRASTGDVLTRRRRRPARPPAPSRPGRPAAGRAPSPSASARPAPSWTASAPCRRRGVTAFAMELVPRISRAQSMDALTSQALVAGYRCALEAAMRLPRFFPLFMTAAGTVRAGAGARARGGRRRPAGDRHRKRLGAVVAAYDVRPASRRRGPLDGRARSSTWPGRGRGRRRLRPGAVAGPRGPPAGAARAARRRIATSLITTAAVPGRPAPLLVTAAMLAGMKPGLGRWSTSPPSPAATSRARSPGEDGRPSTACALYGMKDAASAMPVDASRLYAKNVANLLALHDERRLRASTSTTRSSPARASPRRRGPARADRSAAWRRDGRHRPAHDLRARGLRRLRGRLEGLDHAAHAADVAARTPSTASSWSARSSSPARPTRPSRWSLGLLAVVLATVNIVGGFVVTDRMLRDVQGPRQRRSPADRRPARTDRRPVKASRAPPTAEWTLLLPRRRGLLHPRAQGPVRRPRTARRGNLIGAAGAVIALLVTFFSERPDAPRPDPRRDRRRHRARRARRPPRADDPDAAARRALQRRRRRRRGAGRRARAVRRRTGSSPARRAAPGPRTSVRPAAAGAFTVLVGAVSFAGSVVTFAKLQELMTTRPVVFPGGPLLIGGASLAAVALAVAVVVDAQTAGSAVAAGAARRARARGRRAVRAAGRRRRRARSSSRCSTRSPASRSPPAASCCDNMLLLVAGTLVGASGTILTRLMAAAMGRSVAGDPVRRLPGGSTAGSTAVERPAGALRRAPRTSRSCSATRARSSIVPGYGLAVAQAQHTIRELAEVLEAQGVEVLYGIHPVAGRMPGHMNVLLAEANVPYEALKEMDEVNPEFKTTDVALVVGANDVVNPAAKTTPGAPIYGMPILRGRRGRSRSCSSSGRCARASPASRTSCSTTRARRCCSATPRTR